MMSTNRRRAARAPGTPPPALKAPEEEGSAEHKLPVLRARCPQYTERSARTPGPGEAAVPPRASGSKFASATFVSQRPPAAQVLPLPHCPVSHRGGRAPAGRRVGQSALRLCGRLASARLGPAGPSGAGLPVAARAVDRCHGAQAELGNGPPATITMPPAGAPAPVPPPALTRGRPSCRPPGPAPGQLRLTFSAASGDGRGGPRTRHGRLWAVGWVGRPGDSVSPRIDTKVPMAASSFSRRGGGSEAGFWLPGGERGFPAWRPRAHCPHPGLSSPRAHGKGSPQEEPRLPRPRAGRAQRRGRSQGGDGAAGAVHLLVTA